MISSKVLDHTQDLTGAETYRLTSIYEPPEFVKEASHDRLHGDPAELAPHTYADPLNRLYPAHTKAATWMSTLFLMDKQAEHEPAAFQRLESRLLKAADFFQMRPVIDELREKMAADADDDLARLPDADFALVWVDDTGNKERHYPLRNAGEVKMASVWFDKYRDEFVFDDRHQIANKILDRGREYGAIIQNHEGLMKTAGCGMCAAADISAMFEKRGKLTLRSHPDHSLEIRKMAKTITANPGQSRDPSIRLKMAAIIDQFDRETHLDRLYDKEGLERPEEVLFQVNEKAAQDFVAAHFTVTTGHVYEKSAMDSLNLEQVRKWMGDDFADEVSAGGVFVDAEKLADIAATLPRGDAEMFDRMVAEADVRPFMREKAAAAQGMSDEERRALANMVAQS